MHSYNSDVISSTTLSLIGGSPLLLYPSTLHLRRQIYLLRSLSVKLHFPLPLPSYNKVSIHHLYQHPYQQHNATPWQCIAKMFSVASKSSAGRNPSLYVHSPLIDPYSLIQLSISSSRRAPWLASMIPFPSHYIRSYA